MLTDERRAGRSIVVVLCSAETMDSPCGRSTFCTAFTGSRPQPACPRIRVHDLRHLAASLMIASDVPLGIISKTLRHSTLSVTVNIYGHLARHTAHQAVDAMADTLNAAQAHAA